MYILYDIYITCATDDSDVSKLISSSIEVKVTGGVPESVRGLRKLTPEAPKFEGVSPA